MGKIANADGIGKVGNVVCGDVLWLYIKVGQNRKGEDIIQDVKFQTFGCLPPDEQVLAGEGDWQCISSIQNTTRVLNGNGRKAEVAGVSKRTYGGELLTIVPFVSTFNKFSVTPEHPILCIKRHWLKSARKSGKKCQWLTIEEEELLSTKPRYILAKDLKESDYLVFVANQRVKDLPLFTKDLMRLTGFYLAEGYSSANYSVLTFAFNKDEKENISEVKSLISKIIKKEAKARDRGNVKEIYVCSRKWVKFFADTAGHLAIHKKLSEKILLLPFKKQWQMVQTYIKGDGNIYKRRPKNFLTYRVATASEKLAIQVQEILARGNTFSSIKKYDNPETRNRIQGRRVIARPIYEISFRMERKHKFVHSNGKFFLVPIRAIKRRQYKGDVFNIHVKGEPNSYLVKGFVVHNCVAAISTSSVITELAKGRTLTAALELKKDEIVKSLGGLPPIKIHCSLLAIDALSEAIFNYLHKNKKEIPEDLEKRHQRIEKEKELIKEKYKDWIEAEEKILEQNDQT